MAAMTFRASLISCTGDSDRAKLRSEESSSRQFRLPAVCRRTKRHAAIVGDCQLGFQKEHSLGTGHGAQDFGQTGKQLRRPSYWTGSSRSTSKEEEPFNLVDLQSNKPEDAGLFYIKSSRKSATPSNRNPAKS
jgi:hypothetical protein